MLCCCHWWGVYECVNSLAPLVGINTVDWGETVRWLCSSSHLPVVTRTFAIDRLNEVVVKRYVIQPVVIELMFIRSLRHTVTAWRSVDWHRLRFPGRWLGVSQPLNVHSFWSTQSQIISHQLTIRPHQSTGCTAHFNGLGHSDLINSTGRICHQSIGHSYMRPRNQKCISSYSVDSDTTTMGRWCATLCVLQVADRSMSVQITLSDLEWQDAKAHLPRGSPDIGSYRLT